MMDQSFCINRAITLKIRLYRRNLQYGSGKSFPFFENVFLIIYYTASMQNTRQYTQEVLCSEIILCLIQCLLLEHCCCRSSFSLLFIVCSTVKVIISIQIYFEFCCYISRQFNISLYTALFCCDSAIASIAKTIGKNGLRGRYRHSVKCLLYCSEYN